jgi:hypothetical protein
VFNLVAPKITLLARYADSLISTLIVDNFKFTKEKSNFVDLLTITANEIDYQPHACRFQHILQHRTEAGANDPILKVIVD